MDRGPGLGSGGPSSARAGLLPGRPGLLLGLVTSAFFRWDEPPPPSPDSAAHAQAVLGAVARLLDDPDLGVLEIGSLPGEGLGTAVAAALRRAGVGRVYSGSGPFSSRSDALSCPDAGRRREALELGKSIVADAARCEARLLAIAPGREPDAPAARGPALERLAESLVELGRYADRQSGGTLWLGVETMDRLIHRRQLLSATAEAAAFIGGLRPDAPHTGLILDLSHIPMVGERIADAVAGAGEALIHAHAGNCVLRTGHPLYGDSHPPFGVAGGEIGPGELQQYLRALIRAPYFARRDLPFGGPALSLEIVTRDGEEPFSAVAEAKAVFGEAWRLASGETDRRSASGEAAHPARGEEERARC